MSQSIPIKIFRVTLVGRAGNHTWQLLNAMDFLIENHDEQSGFELTTPSPFFGNRRRFLFPRNTTPITDDTTILVEHANENFFTRKRTRGDWSGSHIWIQYLSPFSIFTPQNTELETLASQERTLTIHFRSGDLFQGNGSHGKYFQPPLKQQCNIITRGTDTGEPWTSIILMSEDTLNPTQNSLVQHLVNHPIEGPVVRVIGRPLVEDIGVLMVASHCVYGFGTFWRVPYQSRMGKYCGTARQIMQFPDYYADKDFANADEKFRQNMRVVPLPGYRDAGGDWRNLPWQRELMVTWGAENE